MRKSLLLCLVWLTCHAGGTMSNAYAQGTVTKTVYKDQDGDGRGDPAKPKSTNNPSQDYVDNNNDCNDKDASIYAGALEIKDRKDNDCDGLVDENVYYQDLDKDGYGSTVKKEAVTQPAGYTHRDGDLDDNDNTVYPNATDICDGKDNDGNGIVDDGGTRITYYRDYDGDTFGDPAVTILSCTEVVGYVTNKNDFDDRDATRYPNAPELCDGKDNDNDGNGDILEAWYVDNDGDTYGAGPATMSCAVPSTTKQWVRNNEDADDANNKTYPGAIEICDGKDNDQNGQTDEGLATVRYHEDADGDGFGATNPMRMVWVCDPSLLPPGNWSTSYTDVIDNDATVYPGAPELCDGKDNNRNNQVDEGVKTTFYADEDKDGYGTPDDTQVACSKPAGYVENDDDANDRDNTIYPNAPELCDGKDNDQDGQADDGLTLTAYYEDRDGDGYGADASKQDACSLLRLPPPGVGWNYVTRGSDAADLDNTVYPGATEICDKKDNDQDGTIDEGVTTTYYKDADADGFGSGTGVADVQACSQPAGYVTNNTDPDDSDKNTYPDAPEICDGKDNNQNGWEDEFIGDIWYRDLDEDGYGSATNTIRACSPPDGIAYVTNGNDAHDNDNTIYPNAPELCDTKDNDQDGTVDEGVIPKWYYDNDGDGYGEMPGYYYYQYGYYGRPAVQSCTKPGPNWAPFTYDLNDRDATVYPNARELCDGKDNNQDNAIDYYVLFRDFDGDGHGGQQVAQYNWWHCSRGIPFDELVPAGFTIKGGFGNIDLDDTDPFIYWGAPELCDGKDNDEDDLIDEQCIPETSSTPVARMDASAESNQFLAPVSSLYPNPATSELTIDLSRPASELRSISISTVVDQKVSFNDYAVMEGSKIKLTVTHLKQGVYVIRLDFGDGYEVLKFIKN